MRAVSIKLPHALDERLSDLARRRKTSRSAVLRDALLAFDKDQGPSVTSVAGDLVGSLDGPRDLSTAPEHMAGYGTDKK